MHHYCRAESVEVGALKQLLEAELFLVDGPFPASQKINELMKEVVFTSPMSSFYTL